MLDAGTTVHPRLLNQMEQTLHSQERWVSEQEDANPSDDADDKVLTVEHLPPELRDEQEYGFKNDEIDLDHDHDYDVPMKLSDEAHVPSESQETPSNVRAGPEEAQDELDDQPLSPPPSPSTLARWSYHNRLDAEARTRRGHGKLNFREFEAKMVEDEDGVDSDDEVGRALGRAKPHDDAGDVGDEGADASDWRPRAGLGKLAFVGTWLEMASF